MAIETVKKDRVGVLASTIINELARDRIVAIQREKDPPPIVFVPTAAMRRVLAQWAVHKRQAAALESKAKALGCALTLHGNDDKPAVSAPYRNRDAERHALKLAADKRTADVRQLRTETLIDLVSMDAKQVKAAVTKFRGAIERI